MPQSGTHRCRYLGPGAYECKNCGERFAHYTDAVGQCPEAPEPWSSWRINEKFLSGLLASFGDREITNKEAYKYYAEHHSRDWKVPPERQSWRDDWLQMNVRNTLCKAAYIGRLIRIAPGRYRFP